MELLKGVHLFNIDPAETDRLKKQIDELTEMRELLRNEIRHAIGSFSKGESEHYRFTYSLRNGVTSFNFKKFFPKLEEFIGSLPQDSLTEMLSKKVSELQSEFTKKGESTRVLTIRAK